MRTNRVGVLTHVVALLLIQGHLMLGSDANPVDGALDISLGPEVRVMEHGIFPYMTRTREGTLIVAGTVLRPNAENYTGPNYPRDMPRTMRSTGNVANWELWEPTASQGDGPIISGCTLQLASGPILIFDYYTRGIGNGKFEGQLWRSEDQWKTVSGPEKFLVDLPQARQSLGDDRGDTIPTGILWHRTILELPNGDLLAGIYGVFEEDKAPSQYRASMQKFRALLLRSRDLGKSWSYVSLLLPRVRWVKRAITSLRSSA